jgi:putative transposase
MDWNSRKILSWNLSITMDKSFCIWALEEAIRIYGLPEIFNSDQGSQFTCGDFTEILLKNGVKISMDGKGRAMDNIMIERFWRSLKYEEVYLKDYENVKNAKESIKNYINLYNNFRPHENLGGITPDMVYFNMVHKKIA